MQTPTGMYLRTCWLHYTHSEKCIGAEFLLSVNNANLMDPLLKNLGLSSYYIIIIYQPTDNVDCPIKGFMT